MNKIILLKNDGSYVTKNESKIKKSDINESEYILIPSDATNTEFRNYIIIKSSEYLLFDKAIIEYQMSAFYYDEDDTCNTSNFAPIDPIHMEVYTISDLFRCINCVDKFNVANNISKDNNNYDNTEIGVIYLSVQLFQNSKEIYSEYYQKKGTSTIAFDSYKVTKKFDDIYDSLICDKMLRKNKYLTISSSSNNKTWCIDTVIDDVLIVGVPLSESNTITFMTLPEFGALDKYKSYFYNFYVYYTKVSAIDSVNRAILRGDSFDDVANKIENCMDVYIAISGGYSYSKRARNYLLEFISHARFIINTINLFYSELYPHDTPLFNEKNNYDKYEFDSAICLKLHNKAKDTYKGIIMNKSTLISFSDIIASL